jgi:protein-L-isoaspartate O-methyltransferase
VIPIALVPTWRDPIHVFIGNAALPPEFPLDSRIPGRDHLQMISGTEGYADEADALVKQYESIAFTDVHRPVLHLIPVTGSHVLDVGAGTGRDAAGFAAMGHRVVAVEPTEALRSRAAVLHPSSLIEWVDDSLPDLAQVTARGRSFDVVMLTAVWMHLDLGQRRRAMPTLASLLRPGGALIMSLRYGPVPTGRRMFAVSVEETIALADAEGLQPILKLEAQDGVLRRPGISWARLAFR